MKIDLSVLKNQIFVLILTLICIILTIIIFKCNNFNANNYYKEIISMPVNDILEIKIKKVTGNNKFGEIFKINNVNDINEIINILKTINPIRLNHPSIDKSYIVEINMKNGEKLNFYMFIIKNDSNVYLDINGPDYSSSDFYHYLLNKGIIKK